MDTVKHVNSSPLQQESKKQKDIKEEAEGQAMIMVADNEGMVNQASNCKPSVDIKNKLIENVGYVKPK